MPRGRALLDLVEEDAEGLVAEAGAALVVGRGLSAEGLGFVQDGEDGFDSRGEVGFLD